MARIPRPNFGANKYFWLGILGSLVILAIVLGSGALKVIGFGEKTIDVEFAQAAGTKADDKVRVAGLEIGRVKSLKLEGDHVLATLQVKNDLEFGPDANAAIKQASILGQTYIDLDPGDGNGLPENRIPLSNTQVPFSLAKVVQDPKYKSQFERLEKLDTDKIAESLAVMGEQLGDSPQLTAQALDSVGVLAKVIDQRRDEVDAMLKNLGDVSRVLGDNRNSILLVVTQGAAIGQAIMERQGLVQQLLDNVGSLSAQLQAIGAGNDGQLGQLIRDLNTMSEGLEKNNDNLVRLLEIMPVTVRQFTNVTGNGNYGDISLPWLFPDNWLCRVSVIEGCQ